MNIVINLGIGLCLVILIALIIIPEMNYVNDFTKANDFCKENELGYAEEIYNELLNPTFCHTLIPNNCNYVKCSNMYAELKDFRINGENFKG